MLWDMKAVFYFELRMEQIQQQGEHRIRYIAPSSVWQSLFAVLRLLSSSCLVQVPPVCQHQERHDFCFICCQVSWVVGHSYTNKSRGYSFLGLTYQRLCLGHSSVLGSWDSTLHLLNHKRSGKNSCLECNPHPISKYRKRQKNIQNLSYLKLMHLSYS